MSFGQPVQFFNTAAQSHTKDFAATNGNQRVRELITLAQCVRGIPRIQVSKNSFAAPRRRRNDHGKCKHQNGQDQEEHAGIHATQKQNAHGDDGNHQERTHVWFSQQEDTCQANSRTHRQYRAEEALFHFHFADHVIGGINDDGQFGKFRRLKINDAQRNPTSGAIHTFANEWQQHCSQKNEGDDEQGPCIFFPCFKRHLER